MNIKLQTLGILLLFVIFNIPFNLVLISELVLSFSVQDVHGSVEANEWNQGYPAGNGQLEEASYSTDTPIKVGGSIPLGR